MNTFTFDQSTVDYITGFEGIVLHPYKDSRGIPTIAIGNTTYCDGTSVTMSDQNIDLDDAKEMLLCYLNNKVLPCLNNVITITQNQNQINSLASLCYNIGNHGFTNSSVVVAINSKEDNNTIHAHWVLWDKPPELLARREKEFQNYIC